MKKNIDVLGDTLSKLKHLKEAGFHVEHMWECQFNELLKTDERMNAVVSSINIATPLQPREALAGGRCGAIYLYYAPKPGECIRYYDIKSLYPYVNRSKEYMIGWHQVITENFGDLSTVHLRYKGFFKCSVLPPRNLLHPVLWMKCNKKLIFPLCAQCALLENPDICDHTENQRALRGVYASIEIVKAVSLGYRILSVDEIWHWEEWRTGLFASYINSLYKYKEESSGWPASCTTEEKKQSYLKQMKEREGICLDPQHIKKNPGMRSIAKLCLNSLWGKFAQRNTLDTVHYFKEPSEFFNLVTSCENEVKSVYMVSDDMVRVTSAKKDFYAETSKHTNVAIAAWTTALGRYV